MVKKAVEDGGGNGAVAVEDGGPLLEGFVGGEHDGAALVALADDLEEEVGAALIDGEVADLVKQKDGWGEIIAQLGFEGAFVPLFWAAERVLITSIALAKRADFPHRHAA